MRRKKPSASVSSWKSCLDTRDYPSSLPSSAPPHPLHHHAFDLKKVGKSSKADMKVWIYIKFKLYIFTSM